MKKPLGKIRVVTGGMFSGKTEELIRRTRRSLIAKRPVFFFTPKRDTRQSEVVSHGGLVLKECGIAATPISSSGDVVSILAVHEEFGLLHLIFDEFQFLDMSFVQLIVHYAKRGHLIDVGGLDLDAFETPFGVMPHVLSYASEVLKLKAICSRCGVDAERSQRISGGKDQYQPGGSEAYEARCLSCYSP